ncbi:UDP-N-acetylglucosamine 1-carboxyvinyltransferase [Pseudemcibacter aquimaris]|uniref:UDP-N-acetylglucosamine 1-carboxyvinyltransferase n=1 Tax=Pseudemcibacter aquimaris TaxID=2857064 RepID=UPI0020120D3E|nr:UDP-N-acetylglucosamine 1-carboxyvinyltransferase [Pseudemcibacter aquimaris]MCC3861170.1 UDP-N-acetylglucosamine 1-carboxyvinyltransferase [Pseudemcibacter aquimaris]WDU57945.1 UDP-N-acetylglucosamine 1-carboxyvinyltransferase [Pseudemcibacter aquimaris]
MDRIAVTGGFALKGSLPISGAKNAALPLMCAGLLTESALTLSNLPHLADISTLKSLLEGHGAETKIEDEGKKLGEGQIISFTTPAITNTTAPYDIVRKMRASILVLGPLLARTGEATVSLPGGCAIGNRPIDLHLKGFEAMGANIELEEGYVRAVAPGGRLKGGTVVFPTVSVGATENILMAATLAEGTTVIENAAREPEIADLASCLIAMGANITGIGTRTLTVEGVDKLHGTEYSVMSDRIEAGSYAIAAAMTRGELELVGENLLEVMTGTVGALHEAGIEFTETDQGVIAKLASDKIKGINVTTQPFPGFPTDMQAQVMAMMTICDSASVINETIFENRFMHVPELTRMGADITMHGSTAIVRGVDQLLGAPVMATDLRASMSLVLAGLVADRQTFVNRIYHLDRGYERLVEKLQNVGAKITRDSGMGI